jgi:hypothetical protein
MDYRRQQKMGSQPKVIIQKVIAMMNIVVGDK